MGVSIVHSPSNPQRILGIDNPIIVAGMYSRDYRESTDICRFSPDANTMNFEIGQFVMLPGSGLGTVTHLPDDCYVSEDHVGVWFGTIDGDGQPIICTIPSDYLRPGPNPVFQH